MKAPFLARKLHKWIALIIGFQVLFWMVSGAYMATIHIDFIHGDSLVKNIKRPLDDNLPLLYSVSATDAGGNATNDYRVRRIRITRVL